jgi:hypothetical protein
MKIIDADESTALNAKRTPVPRNIHWRKHISKPRTDAILLAARAAPTPDIKHLPTDHASICNRKVIPQTLRPGTSHTLDGIYPTLPMELAFQGQLESPHSTPPTTFARDALDRTTVTSC